MTMDMKGSDGQRLRVRERDPAERLVSATARGDDADEAQQLLAAVFKLVQLFAWDEDGRSRTDRHAPVLADHFSLPRKEIDLVLPGMTVKRRKTAWSDFENPHVEIGCPIILGNGPPDRDTLRLSSWIFRRNISVMDYFHRNNYTRDFPSCYGDPPMAAARVKFVSGPPVLPKMRLE